MPTAPNNIPFAMLDFEFVNTIHAIKTIEYIKNKFNIGVISVSNTVIIIYSIFVNYLDFLNLRSLEYNLVVLSSIIRFSSRLRVLADSDFLIRSAFIT
tara:strand:+ start:13091 stop:13384 length:294 start_codon:yes stop_codon:yes gene_type:complete